MEVCEVWKNDPLRCTVTNKVQLTGHINTNDFGTEIAEYGEQDQDKVILDAESIVSVTHHFPVAAPKVSVYSPNIVC